MRVVAKLRGGGTAQSFVIHTTGEGKAKKHSRGASVDHTTIEEAKAVQEKTVARAVSIGWKKREARKGFASKPDAFGVSNLPVPVKATKK